MADHRAYLDVPYSEKDEAKRLGARWDQRARRWYDPSPPTPGLDRWAARPEVSELLPGEDRTFGGGLFVDMVPRSCWFTNVRSCVSEKDWERLRRMVTGRAGRRCEICDASDGRLDVHERWAYDEAAGVQALRRLICVCGDCHLSTHLGYANVTGRAEHALAHLRRVTGTTERQVDEHVQAANDTWIRRSARDWRLDLSMLTDAGVTVVRPTEPEGRREEAEQALQVAQQAPPRVDLARNAPGIGITHEAARRRASEGLGADRSWRVGADGEFAVAEVLAELTEPTRWQRLRGQKPSWYVLHSVPLLGADGRTQIDIDHVVIGPPGVVTINTKHHRAGRVELSEDSLTVNRRPTDYLRKARREAEMAEQLLTAALPSITVRPMIVIVGGRLLRSGWAPGVSVVMSRQLVHTLESMPVVLNADEIAATYDTARWSDVWLAQRLRET